ncbi:putative cutinase [Gordonia phage GTE2]|uniref:Putative cutinase n=1 Tax=Gordonia phage GTE2 TaxID=981323 RepID=F8S0U8_9CAUD|nr:putative cutinase [Gordonia phage GTE2]ADX42623.1 putative cutinase [Gordonia phage GTE2]
MSTYFLALRGTAEAQGSANNMLYKGYLEATVPMTYVDIPYPASITIANEGQDLFGTSLAMSIGTGVKSLKDHIESIRSNDPTARIITAGYSLGCLVLLTAVRDDEYLKKNIDRMILLANPGTKYLLNTGGGRRVSMPFIYDGIVSGMISDEVILEAGKDMLDAHTINWSWDPIAYLHPKSPLRSIAPWLWALDFDDPGQWIDYVRDEIDRKLAWSWTRFWDPGYRDAVFAAPDDLLRYTRGGHHTTAYTDQGNFSFVGKPVSGVWLVGRLASSEAWIND